MNERRKLPRGRCLLGARVIFNNRSLTLNCLVRNRSEKGLLLSFDQESVMPNSFEFQFNDRAALVPAQMIWRSGGRAGIAFPA